MTEVPSLNVSLSKKEKYLTVESQAKALIEGEDSIIANVGNIMSLLKYSLGFYWVGLYKVEEDTLVLNSFQGTVACTRIPKGIGVCGTSWSENKTIIVPNVDEYAGHIACSSATKSEIVLPVRNNHQEVVFVLDVDSEHLNNFDNEDQVGLERIVKVIEGLL